MSRSSVLYFLFLSLLLFAPSCREKSTAPESTEITLSWKTTLPIGEPSGITWNADYSAYYIAGGKDQKVYKTDTAGNILQTLSYNADDIEAVSFSRKDSTLWITEEQSRTLVNISLSGRELTRFTVGVARGPVNKGLEGVTINKEGNFVAVNEKSPTQLLELNPDAYILSALTVTFASDLSDICYNPVSDDYYILSDESEALFIWNKSGGLKQKLTLPRNKFEGVTVNPIKRTITVVNDEDRSMLVYRY